MVELTCQELAELVTDYLEEALSPEDRRRFEEHLAECTDCAHYTTQMQQSIGLTGHLRDTVIDPAEKSKLLAVFEEWKKSQRPSGDA